MPEKPDFIHKSWDTTFRSLWGLLYDGTSDTELKNSISETFAETRKALNGLRRQVEPMATRVNEWRQKLRSYERTITYGEAGDVLKALKEMLAAIKLQAESDRASGNKPPPKGPPKVSPGKQLVAEEEEDTGGFSKEDLEFANTMMGHSKSTAQQRPKSVKPKAKPFVPPTQAELWRDRQRQMANECDNGIKFGNHPVTQESVLRRLNLEAGDGSVWQYRSGPENSHRRIMKSDRNQFWTLGLTHEAKRVAGEFSVYRRDGASSRFTFVSGQRHPDDPDL
jgi:hypothetical protein